MLRLSARRLAAAGNGCRMLSTSAVVRDQADDIGPKAFTKEFMTKVSSTLAPPNFPSDFFKKAEAKEEGGPLPEKLTFSLYLPHKQHSKQSKVDLVLLPAVTGDFVKLDELDPEAVRAGLQEYTGKLGSLQGKSDDYEIAAAQIGVDVYSAMNAALGN
ncbi:hypothetical protein WJX73_004171 [Symbiochloris irregularis]|uniref:Uncharacterized protein n=1 Tax=Symbiochloris irregularis TaxID=706552 RepID=A0AAW1PVM3_9CHLO